MYINEDECRMFKEAFLKKATAITTNKMVGVLY